MRTLLPKRSRRCPRGASSNTMEFPKSISMEGVQSLMFTKRTHYGSVFVGAGHACGMALRRSFVKASYQVPQRRAPIFLESGARDRLGTLRKSGPQHCRRQCPSLSKQTTQSVCPQVSLQYATANPRVPLSKCVPFVLISCIPAVVTRTGIGAPRNQGRPKEAQDFVRSLTRASTRRVVQDTMMDRCI